MFALLHIAGGVALIVFGVRYLRKGLDRIFGARLGHWMQRAAQHRMQAFASGLGLSVVAPSSTTISLLAVDAVKARHLTPGQTLAVMLGANIGLTIVVQLISLRVEEHAAIPVLVGVLLYLLCRTPKWRGIGQVILSLGLIFLAIQIIQMTVRPLVDQMTPESDLGSILAIIEKYPFWLAVFTGALTMMLQSSTATIGMVMALAAAGGGFMALALPMVIGANVGLAFTTFVVAWQERDARIMAMSNLLLKMLVALIALALAGPIMSWISLLPGGPTHEIANMHTGFNVIVALVGLPVVDHLSRFVARWVPAPRQSDKFAPMYIRGIPDSVALALGQSLREVLRVADIVRSMLEDLWKAIETDDPNLTREVRNRDDQVDLLHLEITRYLSRLAKLGIDEEEIAEQMRQLRYLSELESIGDVIDKNLADIAQKKMDQRAQFTPEQQENLNKFHKMVSENLQIAETAFTTRDRMLAQQLLRHKDYLGDFERELRDRHFQQMSKREEGDVYDVGAMYLDLLTHMKRINSSVTHVAYAVLGEPHE